MTDPKKLPVIYARKAFCVPYCGDGIGLVPARTKPPGANEAGEFIELMPTIPRCRTCKHFGADIDMDAGPVLCGHHNGLGKVPRDGSGYCRLHSELSDD